ncbi:hypothetical protein [Bacillus sp. RS11]|uniref:hypothetical protein n=1 Tax=Lysinibacillus sp. RS11 TaxID=3242682 RepID=UPI0035C6EA1F
MCESAAAATALLFVRKRSDSNSNDVGHEGVITGRDVFSLRSPYRFAAGSRATDAFCAKA